MIFILFFTTLPALSPFMRDIYKMMMFFIAFLFPDKIQICFFAWYGINLHRSYDPSKQTDDNKPYLTRWGWLSYEPSDEPNSYTLSFWLNILFMQCIDYALMGPIIPYSSRLQPGWVQF